jgi:hypothetical protein
MRWEYNQQSVTGYKSVVRYRLQPGLSSPRMIISYLGALSEIKHFFLRWFICCAMSFDLDTTLPNADHYKILRATLTGS